MDRKGLAELPLFAPSRRVYTVSELLSRIEGALDEKFKFVWVEGEISGLRRAGSGHLYFALKDEDGQLRAVCFRWQASRLKYVPVEGDQVLILGRINLFAPRGDLQLVVDTIEPRGAGALMAAFVALKAKLAAEGLLDEDRKRPLPIPVRRIGLVTSAQGAAVRDFLRTIHPAGPVFDVRIYPVPVQGEAAPPRIIEAVEYFNRAGSVDVIVLTRGGGSVEDLWAFNDERLARAVADSTIPTVSAVGHETDFTICDFVADVRAATPTAAAALLAGARRDLIARASEFKQGLVRALAGGLQNIRWRLDSSRRALRDPRRMLGEQVQRVDEAAGRLRRLITKTVRDARRHLDILIARLRAAGPDRSVSQARRERDRLTRDLERLIAERLKNSRFRLTALNQRLQALSPVAVLSRGYAIVLNADETRVIRSSTEVDRAEKLRIRLGQGRLGVIVDEVD
jgi:exodeoxyribonuclease VII large subunit